MKKRLRTRSLACIAVLALLAMVGLGLLAGRELASENAGVGRGTGNLNVTIACEKECELEFAVQGDALVSKKSMIDSNCSLHASSEGVQIHCPQRRAPRRS